MAEIRATYRLQLHAGQTLTHARALVPYLSRLGVSHLHCSPLLRSRRGSTHGYDVVDSTMLDPELGTEADLAALHQALRAHGMGLVLDIVPNHMAASAENPAWEEVLAHGPASRYARWFDIEWRASEPGLWSRVLLPVLGDARARVLRRGEITLALEGGIPRVRYHEHGFPLDPGTLPPVLRPAVTASPMLASAVELLRQLPLRTARGPGAAKRRRARAAEALALICQAGQEPSTARALEQAVADFGVGPDGPARLRQLLDAQAYRLVYWRRAAREINYRRFFDVTDLVALHMEDPEIFAQTHARVLEWRRRGWVDGFRVDHPDGLLDPRAYCERLAAAAFPGHAGPPPIFVEKILAPGEHLRPDWPVAGTTGYDFLNQAEALFIAPDGYERLEEEYRRVIRQPLTFPALVRQGKRLVLETALSSGVRRLAERLERLAPAPAGRPVPVRALARAITETIVALPVYRTYVDERAPAAEGEDRRLLEAALAEARARGRAEPAALDLLAAALLGTGGGARLRFVQRFQQLSGPAAAKGVEDTAFYAYAPLLSRNEVGGGSEEPLSRALADFHGGNAERAAHWPGTMLAVTTHDTKRTADVRSRLDVLADLPMEWSGRLDYWRRLNLPHKRSVRGRRLPDPATMHHLLQAMVGIWPAGPIGPGPLEELHRRIAGYMLKAVREAKLRTSWTDPDPEFEAALLADVEALFSPARSPGFLDDLERWITRIARPGLCKAAARTVLHLASPGVPDLYQGDETWTLALVDPDNRRPVDYQQREALLEEVERGASAGAERRRRWLAALAAAPEDGRLKLHLVRSALAARRERPGPFRSRAYRPLEAEGPAREHLVAFGRGEADDLLLAAVPRREVESAFWRDTVIPLPPAWPRAWRCALSSERVEAAPGGLSVEVLFGILPGALLLSDRIP